MPRFAFTRHVIMKPWAWVLVVAFWAVVAVASYSWNAMRISVIAMDMAELRGKLVFDMVQITRSWNARHGGVYAPVSTNTPPNPYLEIPEKVISTPSGRELTLVNPAYMTRQIADLLKRGEVHIHLTSLKPLNPGNVPDSWERDALEAFERGETKRVSISEPAETPAVLRYMAPLRVEKACLACHLKQGYKEGDIRGGLSVTFPAETILTFRGERLQAYRMVHLAGFAALSLMTVLAMASVRRQILKLETERDERETIVRERTEELVREIAIRKRSEAEVAERETMLRSILETAGEGIYEIAPDGTCMMCNPAALRLLGYDDPDELIGKNIHDLVHHSTLDGQPYSIDDCPMHQVTENGKEVHVTDETFWRKNGTPFPVECYSHPVIQNGEVVAAVVSFFDITKQKKLEQELRDQALRDPLTHVYNRRYFTTRLEEEAERAERYMLPLSLAMLDLDHFKMVNDEFGHQA
ncbi:MAG: DUF3365 domain-containing protein, partial [Alphaproteobacteria bacterium]|nr:DUF3365 domain-containing protein [Alphaproteobacteria bacterium]